MNTKEVNDYDPCVDWFVTMNLTAVWTVSHKINKFKSKVYKVRNMKQH